MKALVFVSLVICTFFTSTLYAEDFIWFTGELRGAANGQRIHGDLNMKFAMMDSSQNVIWTNDGSNILPPVSSIAVPVKSGVYSLKLGDTSITGMQALSTIQVSAGTGLRLRVWISNSSGEFEQVTPDYEFGLSTTALKALSVSADAVNSTAIKDDSITNADINSTAAITDSKLAQLTTPGKVAATAVEDKFLRNDGSDTSSGTITAAGFTTTGRTTSDNVVSGNALVSGTVQAASFIGDGSGLTNLNVGTVTVNSSQITDDSITNADINSAAAIADSKLAQLTTADKVAATAVEDKFLRNDGSDASTGTITAAGFTTAGRTTSDNVVSGNALVSGTVQAASFIGDGSGLTNLNVGTVTVNSSQITDDSITNADIKSDAAIADSKLAQLTTADKVSATAVEDKFLRNDGSDASTGTITAAGFTTAGRTTSDNVVSGNALVSGTVQAASFIGDGSGLTNLNVGSVTVNSSQITDDSITNADINSAAAIADSKLAQLTTANKVSATAVEDKFLRNDGSDASTGTITAAGFTTTGRTTSDNVVSGNALVSGTVQAASFIGDGSGLTNLNVGTVTVNSSQITDDSITNADVKSDAAIADSKLAQLTTADKVAATAVEDKFLRNDGSDASTGTITAAGFTTAGRTTSDNVVSGNAQVSGTVQAASFIGDGSGLTNLNVGTVTVNSSQITDDSITNADINSAAAIADSKLAQLTTADKVAATAVEDKFLRNDGSDASTGTITAAGFTTTGRTTSDNVVSGNALVSGTVEAAYFTGNGANLTNLSLGAGTVNSSQITDDSITNADIKSDAAIADSKLDQLTTADKVAATAVEDKFLRNDGSDASTGTITAAGFTTTGRTTSDNVVSGNALVSGTVEAAYFTGNGANLTNLSLGAGTVNSSQITDDSITNADIKSDAAIAESKLAQLTTANKVAATAVEDKFLRNDDSDESSGTITAAGFTTTGRTTSDNVVSGNALVSGTVEAAYFTGNGANLSNVSATTSLTLASYTSSTTITTLPNVAIVNTSNGDVTLTLPSAASCSGKDIVIKEDLSGTGKVTVVANASIDGSTRSIILTPTDGQSELRLVSNGSAWHTIQKNATPSYTMPRTSSDISSGDYFGCSIGISGNTLVVGSRKDDDIGSAYIYEKSGGVWPSTETQKITASDNADWDEFGNSVAISGDIVVVGALYDDDGGFNSGSAYIYEKSGGVWSQTQKITADDPAASDRFGNAVAISGDTVVVGAYQDDDGDANTGSVYIFEKSSGVWPTTQTKKITASDNTRNDYFGNSVAISGDTVVVGAYQDDDGGGMSGSAYIFEKSDGTWTETKKITADDAAATDSFGISVAISGDTVVVGAYWDDDGGNDSGSAYIFEKSGGGVWPATQTERITASDAAAGDNFGSSVAISGDTVVVGAKLDDDGGTDTGSAYIFKKSGGAWPSTQTMKLSAGGTSSTISLSSISISGNTIVFGEDDNGGDTGGGIIQIGDL